MSTSTEQQQPGTSSTIIAKPVIRLATVADIPALQRFFHQHWKNNHILSRDGMLLRWQYGRQVFDNPKETLSLLMVEIKDQIVGILGFIPTSMRLVDGEIVPGCWLSHWLVLEEHRSSGVGLHLFAKLRQLGYEVIAVQAINSIVKRLYRQLGFAIIEDQPRYLCITNPNTTVRLLADVGIKARLHQLMHFAPAESIRPNYRIMPWAAQFNEQFTPCLESFTQHVQGGVRTVDYLNWRYVRHPRFEYRHLAAMNGTQIIGLATYRIERIQDRRERVMRVTDLMASGQIANDLSHALIDIARTEGLSFVDYYCSAKPDAGMLQAGFRVLDKDSPLSGLPSRFQPLDAGYYWLTAAIWCKQGHEKILSPSLYITKSDGDVDRPN